jgi:hypothetical protein
VIPPKPELLRLSTDELLHRRVGLAARIGEPEKVLLGSLVEQTRRCGRAGCQCAAGRPHGPYSYLSPRRGGRGMRYVPRTLVESVRACLQYGEQIEDALGEISAINVELLARRHLS